MFACIYIPDFPVEALVRAEPALRERAVAVLEGKPPLTRVVALNEKARLLGVEKGMTKLQAAVFGEREVPRECSIPENRPGDVHTPGTSKPAILRQRSLTLESSAHAALLDAAHGFTPRVENTACDTLLLDLAGLERLYGTAAAMTRDLANRAASIGVRANVAIAPNPDTAMHAARGFSGITMIGAGEEAQRLSALPVSVLRESFEIFAAKSGEKSQARQQRQKLREQIFDVLERWGIRDFRALSLLPEDALAARLGEAGTALRKMALGQSMHTLVLCQPSVQFEEAMQLECAVETIESLSFILNRMLEQLCARLEARALAAQELCLQLQLEPRLAEEESRSVEELSGNKGASRQEWFVRTLRLPVAMRDAKVFLKLLQLELSANPPGAPVIKVWIRAEPAPPRSVQKGLFLPVTPETEKLEITLARIKALVGEGRAGVARLVDSHRPGSFLLDRFVVPASDHPVRSTTVSDVIERPLLAMRIFRPACRLRVHLVEGCPASLTTDTKALGHVDLQGEVLWSAGPWRSSGEWWAEKRVNDSGMEQFAPWEREEWDIALLHTNEDGARGKNGIALYRIYRDLATNRWFADASYD